MKPKRMFIFSILRGHQRYSRVILSHKSCCLSVQNIKHWKCGIGCWNKRQIFKATLRDEVTEPMIMHCFLLNHLGIEQYYFLGGDILVHFDLMVYQKKKKTFKLFTAASKQNLECAKVQALKSGFYFEPSHIRLIWSILYKKRKRNNKTPLIDVGYKQKHNLSKLPTAWPHSFTFYCTPPYK